MGRRRKLKNPRFIGMVVEAEVKDEIDKARGDLSYGDFFTAWWKREKEYAILIAENESLKRENLELKKRNEELEKLVEKLESQLRLVKGTPKEEREFEELKSKVEKIFAEKSSMKMFDFLRELGYSGSSDKLISQARELIKKHFVQEGMIFVSDKLGLKIVLREGFGELAWTVMRIGSSEVEE